MANDSKGRYILQIATVHAIFTCECGAARRFTLRREITRRATAFFNGEKAWPVEYAENTMVPPALKCRECGGRMKGRVIKGQRTEAECDMACQNAKGDTCACSCGRKNHGMRYAS